MSLQKHNKHRAGKPIRKGFLTAYAARFFLMKFEHSANWDTGGFNAFVFFYRIGGKNYKTAAKVTEKLSPVRLNLKRTEGRLAK
jgi:hypothetical protein